MSHRYGKCRRREEQDTTIRFSTREIPRGEEAFSDYGWDEGRTRGRFYWYDDTAQDWKADMPWSRRDYYETRQWKSRPVPPGDFPYRVTPDGVVDLHPSQWSVR